MKINLPEESKIDEAIKYFETCTTKDLFNFLDGEDDILKQIALLNIEEINSTVEADKILNTLIEHPSETREYCAFLINRLLKNSNYRKYFDSKTALNNIEKAIFDVNPKVCRKILEVLPFFIQLDTLYPMLIKNSFDLIELLQEKNKDKNYLYNKKSFHLYWHIFALGYTLTADFFTKYQEELYNLLEKLLTFKEYTLREKGAYLAKELLHYSSNEKFQAISDKYCNDENFYVKEIFY